MEYFIVTNSFAAPFCSDTGHKYIEADSPRVALERCAAEYSHPCGLYAAMCYSSSDAKNKGESPLATWLSNFEQAKRAASAGKGAYTYCKNGDGEFTIDGVRHKVENPRAGSVV